jgi:hypothetical protein
MKIIVSLLNNEKFFEIEWKFEFYSAYLSVVDCALKKLSEKQ